MAISGRTQGQTPCDDVINREPRVGRWRKIIKMQPTRFLLTTLTPPPWRVDRQQWAHDMALESVHGHKLLVFGGSAR